MKPPSVTPTPTTMLQGARRHSARDDNPAGGPLDALEPPRIPPLVSIAAAREEWPGHIAAAQLRWSELTQVELGDIEGRQPMLATLVQQRYAITQEEADEQVRRFFFARRPR